MSDSGYSGLNGFPRRNNRAVCTQNSNNTCPDQDAYACVFTNRDTELSVTLPGQRVTIPFANSALIRNMVHDPDAGTLKTCIGGDYSIDFILFLYSTVSAICSFIILADDRPLTGGTFTCTLNRGHQVCVGSTMSELDRCEDIQVIFTAPSALGITLVNSTLSVMRLS